LATGACGWGGKKKQWRVKQPGNENRPKGHKPKFVKGLQGPGLHVTKIQEGKKRPSSN